MPKMIKKKVDKNRIADKTIIFFIFLFISLTLFLSRQIFFYKYEPEYYENYYYFSQWNVPNSIRQISDADLYKFAGYRLFYGENPFDLNFGAPPFAKYLFGAAEAVTGNPYWVALFFYFGSIVVVYLTMKELFKDKRIYLLSILLLVTTPFVAAQVRETMLDLPLMFLFLTHSFFFIKYLKKKKLSFLVWSGIFLGLATGTKIGVYTPLLVLAGIGIIAAIRKYKEAIIYPFIVFGGYVISYFPSYFIRHPNPIPWLRLHEKQLKYYLGGGLSDVDHLNQWRGIFTNTYQGWWEPGRMTTLGDWSPILPVGVLAAGFILYKSFKEKDFVWFYLSIFLGIILLVNTFMPFFPRYLVVAIPFIIFLTIRVFRNKIIVVILLILLNLPFLNSSLDMSNPSGDVGTTARFISTRAYRDLYRLLTPQDRGEIPEEKFIHSLEHFFETLDVREISVEIKNIDVEAAKATANLMVTYYTQYGVATHEPTIYYKKVHNQWRIVWNWDYIWEGFEPGSEILLRGTFRGPDTVYIIPRLMYDWTGSLEQLSDITGASTSEIDNRIKLVVPDDLPRFVGYLDDGVNPDEALAIKGVVLKNDDSSQQTKAYLKNKEGRVFEIDLEYEKNF